MKKYEFSSWSCRPLQENLAALLYQIHRAHRRWLVRRYLTYPHSLSRDELIELERYPTVAPMHGSKALFVCLLVAHSVFLNSANQASHLAACSMNLRKGLIPCFRRSLLRLALSLFLRINVLKLSVDKVDPRRERQGARLNIAWPLRQRLRVLQWDHRRWPGWRPIVSENSSHHLVVAGTLHVTQGRWIDVGPRGSFGGVHQTTPRGLPSIEPSPLFGEPCCLALPLG
jgi:hypothetical protein